MASTVNNPAPTTCPAVHGSGPAGRFKPWLVFGLWLSAMTFALGWFNGQSVIAWCRTPPADATPFKSVRPIDATSPGSP